MKSILTLLCILMVLFSSCNNEEIFEDYDNTTAPTETGDIKSQTLAKLISRYGDVVESIEKDVVYAMDSDDNMTRKLGAINDLPIEIAFPYTKRDVIRFKSGATIEICDSLYIFQGDIILNEEQLGLLISPDTGTDEYVNSGNISTKGAVTNYSKYRWKGEIPYLVGNLDPSFRPLVESAIQEWEKACPFIKFRNAATPGTSLLNFDCIVFMHGNGSYSKLGRQGSVQDISIDKNTHLSNVKGTAMHEIGHALGMIHEHCRRDRDNDLIVDMNNIVSKKKHNYEKNTGNLLSTIGTSSSSWGDLTPNPINSTIDFNSIMLYPSYGGSFAKNNSKPIMTKKDGSTFTSQRSYISRHDRLVMFSFYGQSPFVY